MANSKVVRGLSISKPLNEKILCEACLLGKMPRFPFVEGRTRATEIGQLIHSDLMGPIQVSNTVILFLNRNKFMFAYRQVPSLNGSKYCLSFKDDYSGWTDLKFIKAKHEVTDHVKNFIKRFAVEKKKSIVTLRTDRGGEYINTILSQWLEQNGIQHQTSTPHTPQHNSVAERYNRTLMESGRSNLFNSTKQKLPLRLWAEALNCSNYVLNRVLSRSSIELKTPYEIWHGSKPDVSYFKVFGSMAYAHIPDSNRRKLDPKCVKCIFVGYGETSKGYRLWDFESNRVFLSRDVIFNENVQPVFPEHQGDIVKDIFPNMR